MPQSLDNVYENIANSKKAIFVFHSIKNNTDANNILKISLRDIARGGNITPSYVSRIVRSLRDIGFIERHNGGYKIGSQFITTNPILTQEGDIVDKKQV